MNVKLSKPVIFEEQEYTELDLQFEALTGRDIIKAESEARTISGAIGSPVVEFSKPYQAVIAAKAARVPVDLILSLPGKDFTAVTMYAQDFLLDSLPERPSKS